MASDAGFGDTNWRDIISILRSNGYEDDICIEGYHDPVYSGELEMTGQLHALNYLNVQRWRIYTNSMGKIADTGGYFYETWVYYSDP